MCSLGLAAAGVRCRFRFLCDFGRLRHCFDARHGGKFVATGITPTRNELVTDQDRRQFIALRAIEDRLDGRVLDEAGGLLREIDSLDLDALSFQPVEVRQRIAPASDRPRGRKPLSSSTLAGRKL